MSGEQKQLSVFEAPRFTKTINKLPEDELEIVEDQIELIINDPTIGTQKKGDLSYLWVHKFNLSSHQVLLGYSWNEGLLELHLLNIGPHENFYRDAKKRRKADLKVING